MTEGELIYIVNNKSSIENFKLTVISVPIHAVIQVKVCRVYVPEKT